MQLNPLGHRKQAVAPHRHQGRQLETAKQVVDREGEDFGRRAARIRRQQHRDQPLHDGGVAFRGKIQHQRRAGPLGRGQPHAGLAAQHAVRFGLLVLGQRRQRPANLDQIGQPIVRLVELFQLSDDFGKGNGDRHQTLSYEQNQKFVAGYPRPAAESTVSRYTNPKR